MSAVERLPSDDAEAVILRLREVPVGTAIVDPAMGDLALRPSARVERWRAVPDGFDVEVDAPEGGTLMVNTPWTPHWAAEADGRPLALAPANGIAMVAGVPAGSRKVSLRYAPPTIGDAIRMRF